MPSGWAWYAGIVGEPVYEVACDCRSREEALREAARNVGPDEEIQLIEARQSTDRRYEGADSIPFTHTRNHEVIGRLGLALVKEKVSV